MNESELNHPVDQLAIYRELTPAEQQAIHAHLAVCAGCRAQFEAFKHQDALLSALPQRAPRRQRWEKERERNVWIGLARLGDVMAVGGLATMTLAAVIIVRALATAPAQTGSAPLVPGLPFTIPADLPALINPWVLAAPWIGGALSAVGLLLALGQRHRLWGILGVGLAVLLLFSYVQPLTALPNPAGVLWRTAGGYGYDPNLPFKNLFVIADDPTVKLRPYLDRLIGQVGLDPLDPIQPLARYSFERVSVWSGDKRAALVSTRFTYADGSSRVYDVPLFTPMAGLYLGNWHDDGLARLRTEHLALPDQPFATPSSSIRLGDPVRLKLSSQADQLDAANPAHWLWSSNRLQRMVWSPQGDAFLMTEQRPNHTQQLWLVTLDGAAPQSISGNSVYEYGWSPDGAFIVYTGAGEIQISSQVHTEAVQLVAVKRGDLNRPTVRRTLVNASLPSLTLQGIWYTQDGALWLIDYGGGDPIRIIALPGLGRAADYPPVFWPVAVSPDGSRVAYACGADLCLINLGKSEQHVTPASNIHNITWDAVGERLAAVSLDSNNLGPVRLLVVSRDGELLQDVNIAPRDAADPPQWAPGGAPGGEFIFVQTYPMGGRRIIAVNAGTGEVLDLSREHWDAYFALSPDGQNALLNNGRGGFWLAPLIIQREAS